MTFKKFIKSFNKWQTMFRALYINDRRLGGLFVFVDAA